MATLILVNPAAGRGRGLRAAQATLAAALPHWPEAQLKATEGPGDGARLAREAGLAGMERVVVVGGDGTAHEAANGILTLPDAQRPALAVVPVGTGNDFAKLLGTYAHRPARAIAKIAAGTPARFDVGMAGDEYFINSLGVGLDADVARRVNGMKRLRGIPAYLLAALQALGGARPIHLTLDVDGARHDDAYWLLEIGNGTTAGGAFRLTPDARPDDGLLDCCAIRPLSFWQLPFRFPLVFSGKHTRLPQVTMAQGRCLRIHFADGAEPAMHLDGEIRSPVPRTLEVNVRPAALPVIVARH